MARKAKNQDSEVVVENESDHIKEAKLKRAALANERAKEVNQREEFRKFFVKIKSKLNLNPELESVIWIHLKAIKCDKVEKFEEGVKHFGYKI